MANRNKNVGKRKAGQGGKSRGARLALVIGCSVIGAILLIFIALGVYVSGRDTILPNVTVDGIDVSGMSYDVAHSTLLNSELATAQEITATVELTEDVSLTVTDQDAGLAYSVNGAADAAWQVGRDGNFVTNVFSFFKCLLSGYDVVTDAQFDENGVRDMIVQAAQTADHGEIDSSYEITDTQVILTKGTAGYTVDQDAVYNYIYDTLTSGVSGETDQFSEAATSEHGGSSLDIQAIYDQVYVEPQNSVYDKEAQVPTQEVTGVSFDVQAAQRAYDTALPGEDVMVDLIITEPEVTSAALQEMLFRDQLSSKMTTMYSSSSNRVNNITLAAAAINGTILNPGEEFSFNGVVGERTTAKGYKPAGAYVSGETVDQVGGGICQVSSTLYYCTLKANLEVTDRRNHMYSVSYLPLGFDATVNWGTIDYKFKNNQDYPIKIVAYVQNKELYVEIWGTKLDDTYVELQYSTVSTLGYEVIEEIDESLAPGETKVKTSGHGGYVVDSYLLLYDGNGELINKTYLARDTYRSQNRVVLVAPPVEEPEEGEETGEETETGTETGGDTETEGQGGENSEAGGESETETGTEAGNSSEETGAEGGNGQEETETAPSTDNLPPAA